MNRRNRRDNLASIQGVVATALVTLGAVALVSCANVTPPGYVVKEWSAQIRELGIVPIFPPREDVQVGDVYLMPESPQDLDKEEGIVPLGLWACQLNVNGTISKFYKSRSSFPFTSTNLPSQLAALTNNPSGIIGQDRVDADIFQNHGDNQRLRLVGFPQFMSATFTQGDLSALIPIEAVSVALGTSFSDQKSVTVSIPVAESYGVPASVFLPEIFNNPQPEIAPQTVEKRNNLWQDFFYLAPPTDRQQRDTGEFVYAFLINEVYYARAIDISIQMQEGHAATLGASVTGAQQASQVISAVTKTAQATTNAAKVATTNMIFTTNSVSSTLGDPIARANALNALNAANMNNLLLPGGKLNFVSVSDGSVGMRRTYSSPVAIGFRGIVLRIDQYGTVSSEGSYSGKWAPASVGRAKQTR